MTHKKASSVFMLFLWICTLLILSNSPAFAFIYAEAQGTNKYGGVWDGGFGTDNATAEIDIFGNHSFSQVNLGSGILRVYSMASPLDWATAWAAGSDRFTTSGPAGAEFTLTAHLAVTGTLDGPVGSTGSVWAGISLGGTSWNPVLLASFGGGHVDVNTVVTFTNSWTSEAGASFQLAYGLSAITENGATADFLGTGSLSFDFPAGIGVTSEGGFSPVQSVPEPATMLLLGAGLAGLGIMRKRFKG